MFSISKKSHQPTTYYALAFCIHVVAFVLLIIGMFTPNWSQITEQVEGTAATYYVYDKGLVVTCAGVGSSCAGISDFTSLSDVFMAAFVLGIIAIVLGFFAIQLFCAGICIRSCKDANLGVPIAAMSIFEGILLMLVLLLFEISVGRDTRPGNIHRKDTFGFSRGLIVAALILYFLSSFFITGEYMRRYSGPAPAHIRSKEPKPVRPRPHRSYRDHERGNGMLYPTSVAVLPPPYTRTNPVYQAETEERHYSPGNGMRPCKLPGCQMCSFVTGSPTFWGPAGVFNISDRLTCQDSKLVYAIICVKDDKVFIGHSQNKLEETFSKHLTNIKARNKDDPVTVHFTRPDHSSLDLRISALARINCDMETRSRLEKSLSYDMDRPHNSYYGINDDFEFL